MIKKVFMISLFCFLVSAVIPALSLGQVYNSDIIEKIRIKSEDMPDGFTYGKLPTFARKVLKGNPWNMDRKAINRLTRNVYPDGDSSKVDKMHISIIADKETPFGDDIVCYIILFKSQSGAKKEFTKINEYVKFNSDRALVVNSGNLVVYLHVDNSNNFDHIYSIAEKMKKKMKM